MALSSKSFFKNDSFEQFKHKANELLNRTIDQHVRLAITGLSRSGKTAFITSLVNQCQLIPVISREVPTIFLVARLSILWLPKTL